MRHGTRMQLDDHKRRKKAAARKRPRARVRVFTPVHRSYKQNPFTGLVYAAAMLEGLRK